MPKKNFKGISPDNPALPYFSEILSKDIGPDGPGGQAPLNKTQKCHVNLRLSPLQKDYLTDAAWQVRKSITQYLIDLIDADMTIKAGKVE